jgi:predicted permease
MNLRLFHRISAIFHREKLDRDLSAELSAHVDMAIAENLQSGMTPPEARRHALLALGGAQQAMENHRDTRSLPLLETLLQDLRYALRTLRKEPGFTAIAVLTLALGIGANTALFSVVNGVLLNPLPYPQSDRLVALYTRTHDFEHSSIAYPNFLDWVRDNHSFSSLVAFRADNLNLTGVGGAQRLSADMVSASFFPTLGIKPILGRGFTDQEDQLHGAPVAVISEGLWKRKFGSSPEIVGKSITLNNTVYNIVGVIPSGFHFEHNNFSTDAELYLPLGQWDNTLFRDRRAAMGLNSIGRLKPGVTLAQADSDMAAVAAHLAETYPETNKDSGVTLTLLKEDLVGDIRPFLLVLLAAVGFVLLIACVNVANLLLARSTRRNKEFAIRSALGAGRSRITRQLLTESLLLAFLGGALGALLSAWGTQAALKLLPEALPRANEIHVNLRVLLFTFAASVFAGILFGLIPALSGSDANIQETLKGSSRGASGSRHRTQGIFVAAEMALAVVLLVGAGLMIRSLANLWSVNPGFDPHHVLTFNIASAEPFGDTPSATRAAFRRLHDTLSGLPGVQSVSLTFGSQPLQGDSELPFWMEGESKPASQADMKQALLYIVQPSYRDALRINLKRGRFLEDSDDENAPTVVVVDEHFAKQYFGSRNPVGSHITMDMVNKTAEIVGVVGHINQWGLDSDSRNSIQAQCYFPAAQVPDALVPLLAHGAGVVARSSAASALSADSISHAVQSVNSQMVVYGNESMDGVISDSLASQRFAMILLGMFAIVAVILSSLGIYGVISYLVGQRTHEIGIRMALGAARGNIVRMVLSQAGRMVLLGVVIGVLASLALARLMATMLFGVNSCDPFTFLAVAALLSMVAIAASYFPARRASRVDPIIALRYE